MNRTLIGLCAAALIPLTACSQSQPSQAPQQTPVTSPSVPATNPELASVCAAEASRYSPVPAMGPKFPHAPLPMFKVAGAAGVRYASKPQPIGFPRDGATIHVAYAESASDELRVAVCVRLSGPMAGYAYAGPIDSQGGQHPVLAEMFLANADDDPARELVVLAAWEVDDALGTSGTLYEPWIFDPPAGAGVMQRVVLVDPELSFGFDGIREGERVTYPYQDAAALRARLQQLGH